MLSKGMNESLNTPKVESAPILSVVEKPSAPQSEEKRSKTIQPNRSSNINATYIFDNFVEGKSNQLGRAAAMQVTQKTPVALITLYSYMAEQVLVKRTYYMLLVMVF